MGDVVDIAPRADRRASDAHEQLVEGLTENMERDPNVIGTVVLTVSADGLYLWSNRYKDGVERKRLLEALDAVRRAIAADPDLRDE